MKWFCKYWWLFYKYKELEKQYNELVDLVDDSWWNDIEHENLCSDN